MEIFDIDSAIVLIILIASICHDNCLQTKAAVPLKYLLKNI